MLSSTASFTGNRNRAGQDRTARAFADFCRIFGFSESERREREYSGVWD
jgi:hypothetical protein